jgi:hypothetical protein
MCGNGRQRHLDMQQVTQWFFLWYSRQNSVDQHLSQLPAIGLRIIKALLLTTSWKIPRQRTTVTENDLAHNSTLDSSNDWASLCSDSVYGLPEIWNFHTCSYYNYFQLSSAIFCIFKEKEICELRIFLHRDTDQLGAETTRRRSKCAIKRTFLGSSLEVFSLVIFCSKYSKIKSWKLQKNKYFSYCFKSLGVHCKLFWFSLIFITPFYYYTVRLSNNLL